LGERPLNGKPEVDLLDGRALHGVMLKLSDTSNFFDPESNKPFKSLYEILVFHKVLKVFGGHFFTSLFTLLVLLKDFMIMLELNLWNCDVLLALS
jgi:hypothetical protein